VFPHRLSEVTAEEIRHLIEIEAPEALDFELKKTLPCKKGDDPWMTGGKIGEDAREVLASEMCAFANTIGGTLIVGIDEDTETKRAKPPIIPLPKCKELAERLHQSLSARIEPKFPLFECEGVVTEPDGTSGVVVMRTLESYLAPHRHTQDRHCYVRRNDRAEPMSMLEVQEMTRQKARSAEAAERTFNESSARFYSWVPEEHHRSHPYRGVQGVHTAHGSTQVWVGIWAMRLSARPLSPFVLSDLPRQKWLEKMGTGTYTGTGQIKYLVWRDLSTTRTWVPRLRAVEREFEGMNSLGLDRLSSDGLIERFVWQKHLEQKRPRHSFLDLTEFFWNVASVVRNAELIRGTNSRPTQQFALEIEFMTSDGLIIHGYANSPHALVAAGTVTFPRYEIGEPETFDELLTTIDQDVWNLGGYHPTWKLGVNWPKPT
jgi:hypothetical protein